MTATLSLNGLDALSVRLFHPGAGVWTAEVDFDLDKSPDVPSGAAVLKIGTSTLVGTIDSDASGRFGDRARARVIAGGGGWHRTVGEIHFHNDAGVTSLAVASATAAEIGERVIVATPKRLGVDFLRTAGPASRALAGLDWYVDLAGVTIVAPRAPLPATPDVEVLEWDPHEQRATLAADGIVSPGTVLTDKRFGTATIRDVEQTFDSNGARVTAWCASSPGSRLAGLLGSLVRENARVDTLRVYRYRVVIQGPDGRLTLQAVNRTAGVPDSVAIPPWYGIPGATATFVPGGEVALVFLDGDLSQPVVLSYSGKVVQLKIGEGASPVALATAVTAQLEALKAAISAAVPLALDGGVQFKTQLMAALASWPAPIASTKLLTD